MLLLLGLALYAGQSAARADGPPLLIFPVECSYGTDCYIQNYVDTRPGSGYADHTCGHLSYDGHKGTDIRVPDLVTMRTGVAVRAAAAGVVRAVRDGMSDISQDAPEAPPVDGREAGNAVVLRHGNGWETQYSHLKRGSVSVRPNQHVDAGQILGEIGLSGRTVFPHVEFVVRHRGEARDPFTGRARETGCERGSESLWTQATAGRLTYHASAVLTAGFAPVRPKVRAASAGAYAGDTMAPTAEVLTFWVTLMGPQAGDRQVLVLHGPDGEPIARQQRTLTHDQARWFSFVGRHRPAEGWPPGCYVGEYRLLRAAELVHHTRRQIGIGQTCDAPAK